MTPIPVQDDPDAPPELEVLQGMLALLNQALAVEDTPPFGTSAWLELPVADPRRQAALIRDAWRSWAADRGLGAPIASERLERQHAAALDFALSCPSPEATWHDALRAATERAQRRLADARKPRPGDHTGGPVAVWGPTARGSAA